VDCGAASTFAALIGAPKPEAASPIDSPSPGAATDLANAKALCAAGSYDRAFELFHRAADAGNLEAKGYEGIAHLIGRGTHQERKLGIGMLREAASSRDPRAMKALAIAYRTGYGAERNPREAKNWLRKAAVEKGDPEAMWMLGVIYREEGGDSALFWIRRAANARFADALVDLGALYDHGDQVPRNASLAVSYYVWAEKAGSARAAFALGKLYELGEGVRVNHVQAHLWYRRSACRGSTDALNALGNQYLNGHGVPVDSAEATRLFRVAAAAGSPRAAGTLQTLDAPEQPPQWRGPIRWMLEHLSSTRPHLSCGAGPQASTLE
jgi:TPR repeat protein